MDPFLIFDNTKVLDLGIGKRFLSQAKLVKKRLLGYNKFTKNTLVISFSANLCTGFWYRSPSSHSLGPAID